MKILTAAGFVFINAVLLAALVVGSLRKEVRAAESAPAQFASLKTCTRKNPIQPEALSGDCKPYASPDDPNPTVYNGNPANIYTDPVFGTKIKRLTPQPGMPAGGYAPKYAPYQSWSKDGTYLLVGGPRGGLILLQGNDPYKFVRQLNVPRFDGVDEYWAQWSNTNDCMLILVNSNKIQTLDVCRRDEVKTLAAFGSLTDTQGNKLDLQKTAGGLVLKPYIYCQSSQDDKRIASKVVDGGGKPYGFGVFELDLQAGTAKNLWFHKITAPGDVLENEAPANKLPGGACISALGNYVTVSWNTIFSGRSTPIRSVSRRNGVVTITAQSAWAVGIKANSKITVTGVADGSFNGQAVVGNISGNNQLEFHRDGPDADSTGGTVEYEYFGSQLWSADTGKLIAQMSPAESHGDEMLLSDRSEAYAGGFVSQGHDDYRRFEAFEDKTKEFFSAYMPEDFYGPQWHFSGRGSVSSDGLPGWGLLSTYSESKQVDCSPQTVMCAEIDAVKMDNSNVVYRIAHSQSIQHDTNGDADYYDEPHATPNRKFTKIVFGSDWRTFSHRMDVYLVDLGEGAVQGKATN